MRKNTLIPVVGFTFPALLIAVSYLYMAVTYHRGWLLNTIVHENGRYTLLQTIFYFRHFTWEILGKAVYCVYVVGIFFFYGNSRGTFGGKRATEAGKVLFGAAMTAMLIGIAVIMVSRQLGWGEGLNGLLQYRRNELSPSDFGSHWRNHFLSNVALFAASGLCVLLYRKFQAGTWIIREKTLLATAVFAFLALTIIFGFSRAQFEAPSYLGHQLRETFGADLPITMFLALSLMIRLENKYDNAEWEGNSKTATARILLPAVCWLLPVVGITGFLGLKVLQLDIGAELAKVSGARNHSIIGTFSWHFFEHTLDYLFVMVTVYWLYMARLNAAWKRSDR